jgi:hypothetical protein
METSDATLSTERTMQQQRWEIERNSLCTQQLFHYLHGTAWRAGAGQLAIRVSDILELLSMFACVA